MSNNEEIIPDDLKCLVRIISEQQGVIDVLTNINASREQQDIRCVDLEQELFKVVHKFVKCAPSSPNYLDARNELRAALISRGWCLSCGEWSHDCDCNINQD
jgi:hypothetical protein